MTVYQVHAVLNDQVLGTCGHKHRTRDTAAGCRWAPQGQVYNALPIRPVQVVMRGRAERGQVSVTGEKYKAFRAGAEALNMSLSQLVETAVEPVLAAHFGSPTAKAARGPRRP